MRYVLKQKFWSWGDDFKIRDADGKDVFFVDGSDDGRMRRSMVGDGEVVSERDSRWQVRPASPTGTSHDHDPGAV